MAFDFRLVRRLRQERRALLVEIFALALELIALSLRLGLFFFSVRKLRGDPLLARVARVEDRFVKKALQQPH